jgi:hypothetical protein
VTPNKVTPNKVKGREMAGSKRLKSGQKGVWELRVYLGRDEQGRVRHKRVTFRGGSREADKELTRLAAKYEGTPPPWKPQCDGATPPLSTKPSRRGSGTAGRT